MSHVRAGGGPVRRFLIDNIGDHPADIVRLTSERFHCSRQAVHKHLQRLIAEGAVTVSGQTRNRRYALAPLEHWEKH